MKQCPYVALLVTPDRPRGFFHARCERRSVLGSPGWHLHDAPVPEELASAYKGVRIRWRSSNTPDYHVGHLPADVREQGGSA